MSANQDDEQNYLKRFFEKLTLSHWVGATIVIALWIVAVYEIVSYLSEG